MTNTTVDTAALADKAIENIGADLGLDPKDAPQSFRDDVKSAIDELIAQGETPADAEADVVAEAEAAMVGDTE